MVWRSSFFVISRTLFQRICSSKQIHARMAGGLPGLHNKTRPIAKSKGDATQPWQQWFIPHGLGNTDVRLVTHLLP